MKPLFEVGQWVRCVCQDVPADRTQVVEIEKADGFTVRATETKTRKKGWLQAGIYYGLSHCDPGTYVHESQVKPLPDHRPADDEEFTDFIKKKFSSKRAGITKPAFVGVRMWPELDNLGKSD